MSPNKWDSSGTPLILINLGLSTTTAWRPTVNRITLPRNCSLMMPDKSLFTGPCVTDVAAYLAPDDRVDHACLATVAACGSVVPATYF